MINLQKLNILYLQLFRLKQGQQKERSQTESWNSSNKVSESSTNGVKPLSIYNSLVPYIDSDKDGSDGESSSLSGGDTTVSVIVGKIKHSSDQKVPDKKPLVMRPKEDFDDQGTKETPPKKCLVLKPQNDDSPINELEKEVLPTKKCLVLKPKEDDELSEVKIEPESIKKCLVRIPKDDNELSNSSKISHSIESKDVDKKNRRRENGVMESDNHKSKNRFDHSSFNGLVIFF